MEPYPKESGPETEQQLHLTMDSQNVLYQFSNMGLELR